MQWKNNKSALGLDIGQQEVKAVLLRQDSKGLLVSQMELLSIREEGILDEEELYNSIVSWLKATKLLDCSTCAGLPQYLTTPQISDFPPNIDTDTLETLVQNETNHLSGLSDEVFIHDYQPLGEITGKKNPVLIGVCRESVIDEYFDRFKQLGINVQDMGMNGLALANAFYFLYPDERNNDALQILLDLGTENCTLTMLIKGQVVYVSSLLFAANRFVKIISQELSCSEADAETEKEKFKADWQDPESPFQAAVKQLENEIRAALEHWQQSEASDDSQLFLSKIWITGGGANLWGLNAQLIRLFSCPVETISAENLALAPSLEQPDKNKSFSHCTALGLALQGINKADFNISLIPPLLRWQQEKITKLPFLRATAAIISFALLFYLIWFYFHVSREQSYYEEQITELNSCNSLLPGLNRALEEISTQQKLLIPLVELGSRSDRFLATLTELQSALSSESGTPNGWCIYIADQFSYLHSISSQSEKKETAVEPTIRRTNPLDFSSQTKKSSETEELPENYIPIHKIQLLEKMIVGGYTIVPPDKALVEPTKELQEKLNNGNVFNNVDWFNEWEEEHHLKIFRPWQEHTASINRNRGRRNVKTQQDRYYNFNIQLPFKDPVVKKPEPPAPKTSRRRRR